MIPDPAPPFEVDASGTMKDRTRRMLQRAGELGAQPAISQELTAILQRLTLEPRVWGDPIRHFRKLQMTQYGGTSRWFRCEYSVHDRIPTVVLTNLFPLPGNPIYGETFDV
ncbi:MAG: hypothetical protein J2P46_01735 [Zavarzinella sp.]|nr:hypothetical protein [Zavarzinella sp.]